MFSSTRGNSFGISKKILCVIMTISLSLMMLPSALFRTEAQAASPTNDDVFVKADSDMTNFGQFAYNPNLNAANISTYTQNDLLHAIGCKAETEASLQDQVANEVKSFLVKNQFSLVDDVFPAVKEGYTIKGTSIANVASQLASLTATYDKTKGTAKFVTAAPASSLDTGVVIITAEYAKLVAEYDAVFSNLTTDLAKAEELVINTKTCEGKVTITPTANKDANGKTIYKLNVDTAIKNINKLDNSLNVSVYTDANAKEGEPSIVVDNDTVSVDLSTIIPDQDMREVVDMKGQLVSVVEGEAGKILLEDGSFTYLGVVDDYADAILSSTAYSVKNVAISNVAIQTKSGANDIFALYSDESRINLDTKYELEITSPKFNIKAPVLISDFSGLIDFYDEDDMEPTHKINPSTDSFPGEYVTVAGKDSVTVCNSTDSSIAFKESCKACSRPDSGSEATAKLLIKTTTNYNVVVYVEQKCTFISNSGYKGYTVEDAELSPLFPGVSLINDVWSFFFGAGKLKVKFRYAETDVSKNYQKIKVSSGKWGKNAILESSQVSPEGTDRVFTVEFGNVEEANSVIKDLDSKYIVTFNNNDSRKSYDLVANDSTAKTLIANAPQPDNVEISWSGGSEPAKIGTTDVSFSIVVTMPTGEGNIFNYTKAYKKTDTVATLKDTANGVQADPDVVLTYENFSQGIDADADKWTIKNKEIKATEGTEHTYVLTIPVVKDLLGRDAKEGQKTEYKYEFSIDKRNPTLQVTWEPDEPVGVQGDFYNQPRRANLNVNEMNFDSNRITIHQKFTDNDGKITEGDLTGLVWGGSDFDHSTSFLCDKEGDYEFSFSGADKANHELTGDIQDVSFTTDWTAPNINVSFDNNAVVNGKYFTSARTATITIFEHNFNADLMNVNPIVTSGNDGTIGFATKSGWTDSGNSHVMTVSYVSEGTYSMVIEGKDMAENAMMPYSCSEFVIDWTKPTITISGVENRQAYGDAAQPNVTINDANMSDATTCQVESLGATKGHPYNAGPSATPAVYTYSYANPERVPENDGVYRINVNAVDMAGNGDVQERVWSVNRFGSTYVIDAETEKIMDGYVNKDSIKDIIVTEINPSGVDNHSIDMTKGSFTETLNEGSDYTAAASGGDGTWYECVYTIKKDFFKEDGKYTLNYISKDKAGNENENTMENKNADRNAAVNVQFMYDNTKPTVSFDNLSEGLYAEANHKANANFEDNSKKFSEAKVIINGEENYVSGDDMDKKHNAIDFELKDSGTPYTIEAVAIDKAGNEMNKDVKTVVVTMNPFLLWFYNTPLFVGSLVGAGVIVAGVLFFLYRRGLWIFKK